MEKIVELCNTLSTMLHFGQFAEVDALMRNIEVSQTSTEELVAWCRYSYCANFHLQEWKNLVNKVESELLNRGEDAERILRGLL